ncbi:MAG TPA: hypothetical protein VJN95_08685 [Gemmatimonadales bacterium]|nr:hypothetical protein [Gemmatimonadales bacterium]
MVEPVRAVAEWLAGTTLDYASQPQGIAAQLAAMTYDGTDTAPSAPDVTAETDDPIAGRGELPDTAMAVTVAIDRLAMPATALSGVKIGKLRLLVRVVRTASATHEVVRDSYYVARAIMRSLQQFHRNENQFARQRNNIYIGPEPNMALDYFTPAADRDDNQVTTAWAVDYALRELAP